MGYQNEAALGLDDFEWFECGFDRWELGYKTHVFIIAVVTHSNGWNVQVLFDDSQHTPLHVDSLDAAKALAQITAVQYMERYHDKLRSNFYIKRAPRDVPQPFRRGVFKVG